MMYPCPYGMAAWMCTYHLHCVDQTLCQHKRNKELSEQEPGEKVKDCEEFIVDKRFRDHAKRIMDNPGE
ncbi:unnamed protein product [marine sediment metagenome]|uniref:Uncharacterized protein n=1 Tax=marine sediment metagenome TaxID=412755 RepID=X0ZM79_9ZZZZ